jgi:hypothetical protein
MGSFAEQTSHSPCLGCIELQMFSTANSCSSNHSFNFLPHIHLPYIPDARLPNRTIFGSKFLPLNRYYTGYLLNSLWRIEPIGHRLLATHFCFFSCADGRIETVDHPSVMLMTCYSCLADHSITPNSSFVDVPSEADLYSWRMLADIENSMIPAVV